MLRRKAEFPLILGEVIGTNDKPEDPDGWKGRPDGSKDPITGEPIKEKWTWCVKIWALKMTVNDNLSKIPDIRKAVWWSPNYIIDYERATNHNHMFFDDKTTERVQKEFSKHTTKRMGKKGGHSILYVDFDNPNHGFILLDKNAEFTKSQSLLSKHCIKCLVRRDDTVRCELDKFAQDKLSELEEKKGVSHGKGSSSSGVDSSNSAESTSYSPFLALVDKVDASESDESDAGGIFEEDLNDDDDDDDEKAQKENGGQIVAAFIDKVNASKDDEELEAENDDSEESEEPDDVVFVGGRPQPLPSVCAPILAIHDAVASSPQGPKRKGRPPGAKNVAKKKKI